MRTLLVLGGISLILLAIGVPSLAGPGALTPEQEAERAAAMAARDTREAHVALAESIVGETGPKAVSERVLKRFSAASGWTDEDLASLERCYERHARLALTAEESIDPRRRHAARCVARELERGLEAVSAHLRAEDAEAARTALGRSVLAADNRIETVQTDLLARTR